MASLQGGEPDLPATKNDGASPVEGLKPVQLLPDGVVDLAAEDDGGRQHARPREDQGCSHDLVEAEPLDSVSLRVFGHLPCNRTTLSCACLSARAPRVDAPHSRIGAFRPGSQSSAAFRILQDVQAKSGGFEDNKVTVLANQAEAAETVDAQQGDYNYKKPLAQASGQKEKVDVFE